MEEGVSWPPSGGGDGNGRWRWRWGWGWGPDQLTAWLSACFYAVAFDSCKNRILSLILSISRENYNYQTRPSIIFCQKVRRPSAKTLTTFSIASNKHILVVDIFLDSLDLSLHLHLYLHLHLWLPHASATATCDWVWIECTPDRHLGVTRPARQTDRQTDRQTPQCRLVTHQTLLKRHSSIV